MNNRLVWTFAICIVAAAGLAFRTVGLKRRPMHTDEAVEAYRTAPLLEGGAYKYHPHEYHGPALHYFTLPAAWISGTENIEQTDETTFRIVPAVFGAALILMLPLLYGGLSKPALLWAAGITAVSHFMVFYNRYYIHETLLVFFTFVLIAFAWRYCSTGRWVRAVLAGVSAGLAHATKETCIIAFAAMGAALTIVAAWARLGRGEGVRRERKLKIIHVVIAVIAAAVVSVVLYSSFGSNWSGPADSIRSYVQFAGRAQDAKIHHHPWYFYLKRLTFFHNAPGLWWSEGIIAALAIVGLAAAMTGRTKGDVRLARFIAIYTLIIAAIYSAIPYKTPWSFMGPLHGMILLGGIGAAAIVRAAGKLHLKIPVVILIAAGVAHLGYQAYLGNFRFHADRRNPYVYAHTTCDVPRLSDWLDRLAKAHPRARAMVITVVAPGADYWPLPWYFRRFDYVGYHSMWPDPATIDASAVVITHSDFGTRPDGFVQKGYAGLRPDVTMNVYLRRRLWRRFARGANGRD